MEFGCKLMNPDVSRSGSGFMLTIDTESRPAFILILIFLDYIIQIEKYKKGPSALVAFIAAAAKANISCLSLFRSFLRQIKSSLSSLHYLCGCVHLIIIISHHFFFPVTASNKL